jgi:hypothetical protein
LVERVARVTEEALIALSTPIDYVDEMSTSFLYGSE